MRSFILKELSIYSYEQLNKTRCNSITYNITFLDLHSNRLDYWTYQYEKEKKILFDQYQSEMKTYKERKFKAHKELECVYHSLENKNDTQKMCEEKVHSEKVDIIKSQVRHIHRAL